MTVTEKPFPEGGDFVIVKTNIITGDCAPGETGKKQSGLIPSIVVADTVHGLFAVGNSGINIPPPVERGVA